MSSDLLYPKNDEATRLIFAIYPTFSFYIYYNTILTSSIET